MVAKTMKSAAWMAAHPTLATRDGRKTKKSPRIAPRAFCRIRQRGSVLLLRGLVDGVAAGGRLALLAVVDLHWRMVVLQRARLGVDRVDLCQLAAVVVVSGEAVVDRHARQVLQVHFADL